MLYTMKVFCELKPVSLIVESDPQLGKQQTRVFLLLEQVFKLWP